MPFKCLLVKIVREFSHSTHHLTASVNTDLNTLVIAATITRHICDNRTLLHAAMIRFGYRSALYGDIECSAW